jgi:hypothetical protein
VLEAEEVNMGPAYELDPSMFDGGVAGWIQ